MSISAEWKLRFWKKVRKSKGCWFWTASTAGKGYGVLGKPGGGGYIYAHRFSYLIHKGAIPPRTEVCHSCDIPCCVNPEHLFLGTRLDNARDMVKKRRSLFGARNPNAKLNDRTVAQIRGISLALSHAELARRFGVSPTVIAEVRTKKTWGHVS